MVDNVKIDPSVDSAAIDIATDEIDDVHYPIYKQAFGGNDSVTQVEDNRPLPVSIVSGEVLDDILTQLKILNTYMAEGFDMKITEEDL